MFWSRHRVCDPFRVGRFVYPVSGGVAALNPRLISRIPSGWRSAALRVASQKKLKLLEQQYNQTEDNKQCPPRSCWFPLGTCLMNASLKYLCEREEPNRTNAERSTDRKRPQRNSLLNMVQRSNERSKG